MPRADLAPRAEYRPEVSPAEVEVVSMAAAAKAVVVSVNWDQQVPRYGLHRSQNSLFFADSSYAPFLLRHGSLSKKGSTLTMESG